MVDGIYYTIIFILGLDSPILLWDILFSLLIIFLGGGGLPIFLNVGTELTHRRRMPNYSILIRKVPMVFFKNSSIIHVLPIVNPFRYLVLNV